MTWDEIAVVEPRLQELYDEARAVRDGKKEGRFCANMIWSERFRPRLVRLAGFYAAKEDLRTTTAYEIAYEKIYRPLPACRNCSCL